MRSNDVKTKEACRLSLQQALEKNDREAFSQAMEEMMGAIAEELRGDYAEAFVGLQRENDRNILAKRGIRQLTSEELTYYQRLSEIAGGNDPKMGLSDIPFPETIIDAVFEDLTQNHPLLDKINFVNTKAGINFLLNTNGYQKAAWGQLCAEVVKEAVSGFKEVDTGLLKLSAFLPVCKAMLDLGYEWLDRYVRSVLYEMLANGLEYGIINGSGNNEPIGMIRQSGPDVTVTGGVYPQKDLIEVSDLGSATMGNLISLLATNPQGTARTVKNLILVVNPIDYYQKVMPATTMLLPNGDYRNDILPYPTAIITSAAVSQGRAVFGLADKYFMGVGSGSRNGVLDYSDHYQFLEDYRTYMIKLYANGFPVDDNAFLYLDISGLQERKLPVESTAATLSHDATLSSLKVGNLVLSPTFASATTSYAVTTTAASNVIKAYPTEAAAIVVIKNGDTVVPNGTAAVWTTGANTLTVTVTACDGTTTETYTVTVTKS